MAKIAAKSTKNPSLATPLNGDLIKYIKHSTLFKALSKAAIEDVKQNLNWIHLNKGEMLYSNNEATGGMYIIVSGRLGAAVAKTDGTVSNQRDLLPGAVVGEMSLFTGQQQLHSVYAHETSNLVQFSKTAFDALIKLHPIVMTRFSELMIPHLRRIQLINALTKLFGPLDKSTFNDLESRLKWQHLYNGDRLIQQGNIGNSLYIVISGRLNVEVERNDGSKRLLAEVTRGESIGELSLLTGEKRSASVNAIRDTVVAKLSKTEFDGFVKKYPEMMARFTPLIINRLQEAIQSVARINRKIGTIAIIPADPQTPLENFVKELVTALTLFGPTLHLSSTEFDFRIGKNGAAQIPRGDPHSLILETWLSEQETIYQYIVYQVDPNWTPWTTRCIRNADRILIVGTAGSVPIITELEQKMNQIAISTPKDLVLLHNRFTDHPRGTEQWLNKRNVQSHHHVRPHNIEDIQRLARRLTGKAVGLVLSGGVARGFAHVGVIRAIREAGIPIDIIGGTSIGAIVAATYALGWSHEEMVEAAKTFVSPKQFIDLTLPLVSIANSYKASKIIEAKFGNVEIEDLWLPYFCISSNLSKAKQMIHQQGPLWKYLRASFSLPGIFTPVVDNNDLLVDGAMLNNLPIDVMRELCGEGSVIAVDVGAEADVVEHYEFTSNLSGWKVLWSKLNPFATEIKAPPILDTILRSVSLNSLYRKHTDKALADVFITPPVAHFRSTDFSHYEELIEVGYQAGKTAITEWLEKQKEAWDEEYGQQLA